MESNSEDKNDKDVIADMCGEIVRLLPERIEPVFAKGKHIRFNEAMLRLKERLGDTYYEYSAILTFLMQEIDLFDRLLSEVAKSTSLVVKAMQGELRITPQSEQLIHELLLQQVPTQWMV